MRRLALLLSIAAPLWLAGCDMLGIESASAVAARREADGKAVGAGCRHVGARRSSSATRSTGASTSAAIFAGWREMNDYMRENKMDAMPPQPDTEMAAADAVGPRSRAE